LPPGPFHFGMSQRKDETPEARAGRDQEHQPPHLRGEISGAYSLQRPTCLILAHRAPGSLTARTTRGDTLLRRVKGVIYWAGPSLARVRSWPAPLCPAPDPNAKWRRACEIGWRQRAAAGKAGVKARVIIAPSD